MQARHIYEEAEYVASRIRRLVMEEGYRWREIAVILRRQEPWKGALDAALRRWEVPCFLDYPRSVEAEPIMRFVLEAFGVVNHSFRSDEIFSLLKTGLSGLSPQESALLENYVFLWKITGKKWLAEWTENPEGFVEKSTPEQAGLLEQLNSLRRRVTEPLERFSRSLQNADGQEAAQAVYRLLTDFGVEETLPALCRSLRESGQGEAADRQLRLWDVLMNILDQTAMVLKDRRLDPERYAQLLRLVMQAGEISNIPQQVDEITIGTADRMRPAEPKVVFLLGAVLGEFPLTPHPRRRVQRRGAPGSGGAGAAPQRFFGGAGLGGAVLGLSGSVQPLGEALCLLAHRFRGGSLLPLGDCGGNQRDFPSYQNRSRFRHAPGAGGRRGPGGIFPAGPEVEFRRPGERGPAHFAVGAPGICRADAGSPAGGGPIPHGLPKCGKRPGAVFRQEPFRHPD